MINLLNSKGFAVIRRPLHQYNELVYLRCTSIDEAKREAKALNLSDSKNYYFAINYSEEF